MSHESTLMMNRLRFNHHNHQLKLRKGQATPGRNTTMTNYHNTIEGLPNFNVDTTRSISDYNNLTGRSIKTFAAKTSQLTLGNKSASVTPYAKKKLDIKNQDILYNQFEQGIHEKYKIT